MKSVKNILFIGLITLLSIANLQAQDSISAREKHFNVSGNLAIKGYDPVAYFTENKGIKGNKQYSYEYKGILYRFVSVANMEQFKKEPSKYEPVYGGWCAYAVGFNGEKVGVNPNTFKIINGKLYLFYNKFGTNTLTMWNEDEKNLKLKADKVWGGIIKE